MQEFTRGHRAEAGIIDWSDCKIATEEINKILKPMLNPTEIGMSLKSISNRLKNMDFYKSEPCKTYGCSECKHFQKEEGYDQGRGWFGFLYYKCKKQPDRNMYNRDNIYDIFDIEPDYNLNFHYDKAKGECPYFERGENELIYMTDEEKKECI